MNDSPEMQMPTPAAEALHDLASEYVHKDKLIKDLESAAKAMRREKGEIADRLLTGMIEAGAPSVEVYVQEGDAKVKAKVYPTSKMYARRDPDVEMSFFENALRDAGLGELIKQTVNVNSLSAAVREFAEEAGVRDSGPTQIKEALPEALASAVSISTAPTLAIRRS